MVCDSFCHCVCLAVTTAPAAAKIRSVYPPHGQWPAPIGSWRVIYGHSPLDSIALPFFFLLKVQWEITMKVT